VLLITSLLAWLLILCLAVANGALREAVLIPSLGRSFGLVLSGVLLSLLIALVAYAFVRSRTRHSPAQGMFVGVFWLFLTLVFEMSASAGSFSTSHGPSCWMPIHSRAGTFGLWSCSSRFSRRTSLPSFVRDPSMLSAAA